MQSAWILSGEMWAEMATNYFSNANAPSLSQRLLSTDAGYIPLPQRIIALLGNALDLPASSVPYFYTWSAILLTGIMVGAFCLRQFRVLVKSDVLRFLAAISILIVADFETRTFVNFTYFAAFFTGIVTALALADDSTEVPRWAWLIPILMVSKPAVLSVLPAMVLVATVSKPRFRLITLAVIFLCMAQVIRMAFSHTEGAFATANEFGVAAKLYAAIKYFVGFAGAYLAGKAVSPELYRPIWFGVPVLAACVFVVFKRRANSSALIFVGLSLLFFNVALNTFALSDSWNIDMARLQGAPLYRHIIVGFFGVVMVVVGLASIIGDRSRVSSYAVVNNLGPVLFAVWFTISGWLSFAGGINRTPGSPALHNSQWQGMAHAIDSKEPICVPVDPLGWVYQRNCSQLNPDINWEKEFKFDSLATDGYSSSLTISPPSSASDKNLFSIAALVKPNTLHMAFVDAKAVVNMKDGTSKYLVGGRQLSASGGLLMLTIKGVIPIKDIHSVTLVFGGPIELGFVANDPSSAPGILWMGTDQ